MRMKTKFWIMVREKFTMASGIMMSLLGGDNDIHDKITDETFLSYDDDHIDSDDEVVTEASSDDAGNERVCM